MITNTTNNGKISLTHEITTHSTKETKGNGFTTPVFKQGRNNYIGVVAKGFSMTFSNGLTISVQFGYGNYGSNRNQTAVAGIYTDATSVEVAVINYSADQFVSGQFVTPSATEAAQQNMEVLPRVHIDELPRIMTAVQSWKPKVGVDAVVDDKKALLDIMNEIAKEEGGAE